MSDNANTPTALKIGFFWHAGFNEGYIWWDDEFRSNRNGVSGALPDGTYDHDTLIQYCCRTDGYATNEIILPADKPFVLFKANSHQCQKVRGMIASEEYFYWDCENWFTRNKSGGSRPHAIIDKNILMHYCYYIPRY